jgi:hypothetical protein
MRTLNEIAELLTQVGLDLAALAEAEAPIREGDEVKFVDENGKEQIGYVAEVTVAAAGERQYHIRKMERITTTTYVRLQGYIAKVNSRE